MLKIVKTSLLLVTASLVFSGVARADINSDLQNICTIVKADDVSELRKKMKKVQDEHGLKLQDFYTGVSCGGDSLIRHALVSNAVESGKLMVKKMPKSQLNAPESDGKTLRAWISEKGLMDNDIAKELNERI